MLELNFTFVFVLLSFIIFVFLMKLICYEPILKIIEEREKFISKTNDETNLTNQKKQQVATKMVKEISSSKLKGSNMINAAVIQNNKIAQEAIKNKKVELQNAIEHLDSELKGEMDTAMEELKTCAKDFVEQGVKKILKVESADIEIDEAKFKEALK